MPVIVLNPYINPPAGTCSFVEVQQLIEPGTSGRYGIGRHITGDGTTIFVADDRDSSSWVAPGWIGKVYSYTKSGATWTLYDIMLPSDPNGSPQFGGLGGITSSVDGSILAIGARGDDTGALDGGAVYIFNKVGGSYALVQTIEHNVVASEFGRTLSMSDDGSVLLISASGEKDAGLGIYGRVYIYRNIAGTWTFDQILDPTSGDSANQFGYMAQLSNDGTVAAIIASDIDNTGVLYIFEDVAGSFVLAQKIVGSNISAFDDFGSGGVTMTANGDTIITGSPIAPGPDNGIIHVFNRSGGAWSEVQAITRTSTSTLGSSVATTADGIKLAAGSSSGVIVYDRSGGSFVESQVLVKSVKSGGSVMSNDGNVLLTTSPIVPEQVYVFECV